MNELTMAESRALYEALDDEYRALATYEQVLADFGAVQPFSNIRDAEARHIEVLRGLFTRYGLPVPENHWPGKVERYASLQAACEAGVAAEIAPMPKSTSGCLRRQNVRIFSWCFAISSKPRSSTTCRHSGVVRKAP